MSVVHGLNRQQYQLNPQPFSKGGEGEIYNIYNQPNQVAKIYHPDRISTELESKLIIMVSRPPNPLVLSQVAWPLDVIYDANNQFCGFIMPKLNIDVALRDLYEYPPQKYKSVSVSQKICIAQNICAVISEVHRAGYVFGDFNPLNIGINLTDGKVAFLDTDSYHIYDQKTGSTYRCKVCLDGYVAPELLKACENYPKDAYATAPLPTFTKETDNFALAIHIFKLLMNGYTPYNGIPETVQGSTASPGVGNNAIKRDSYCFKPGNKPQAVAVPPLEVLSDEIVDLFTRAFMLGKLDPKQRPDAVEWHEALGRYEKSLQTCHRNSAHLYRNGLSTCPWCEADQRYANAIAPTISQKPFSTPVTVSGGARTTALGSTSTTKIHTPTRSLSSTVPKANTSSRTFGLIVVLLAVVGILWAGVTANQKMSSNNLVTGDVITKTGSTKSGSLFDVWVNNASTKSKYVAFKVTGQFEDGTTETLLGNAHAAIMAEDIPANSKQNYSIYFDFGYYNGYQEKTVTIIDCSIIVGDSSNVGYSFNENQVTFPCDSQKSVVLPTSTEIVKAGESPEFYLRYVQPSGRIFSIYELKPPDYQSPISIFSGENFSSHVSISPDGTLLLFGDKNGFNGDFGVMDVNGGQVQNIGTGKNPTWAPGNKIAYITYDYSKEEDEICVVDTFGNSNGCQAIQLNTNSMGPDMAAYDPSGTKIAYVSGFDLYLMNSDGSGKHNVLLYTEESCDDPTYLFWSPDGLHIAFLSEGYDNYQLCVINSDETELKMLDSTVSGMPAWSPDGKWIAFPGYPWAASLELISADGNNKQTLLNDRDYGEWFAPFWMP